MSGQWISIAAADGNASRAYLAIPEAGHGPGLVLLDETFAQEIADLYAAEGYVVLCPEQLDSDISATIAALRTHPECTGKVSVLGFGAAAGSPFSRQLRAASTARLFITAPASRRRSIRLRASPARWSCISPRKIRTCRRRQLRGSKRRS
jgi:hypothetical protein